MKIIVASVLLLYSSLHIVSAEEVYKRRDAQGNVEFSDRESPDAELIEVDPNVVDVEEVKPLPPLPERTPKRTVAQPDDTETEIIHRGTDTDDIRRRKMNQAKQALKEKGVNIKPGQSVPQKGTVIRRSVH